MFSTTALTLITATLTYYHSSALRNLLAAQHVTSTSLTVLLVRAVRLHNGATLRSASLLRHAMQRLGFLTAGKLNNSCRGFQERFRDMKYGYAASHFRSF